jgi:hypothetical protein
VWSLKKAFQISDVQAMMGHADVNTTSRYVHHRPGANDAARLSAAFYGESLSSSLSSNGQFGGDKATLSETKSPASTGDGTLPGKS